MKPLERARRWQAKQKDDGWTPARIAEAEGVTVPTVYNVLRLLKLAAELQQAVDDGSLPLRIATKLARRPPAEQLEAYRRMVAADATHGARAARSVAAVKRGELDKVGRSTQALRSHEFLERWYCVLRSRPDRVLDARQVLAFALGEPPPDDPVFLQTLAEAGYRPRRYERAK